MLKNVLICGLGGGLDVLNCLPLYYKFRDDENYNAVHLGSIRPAPQSSIENEIGKYHDQATCVDNTSNITYKGRYAEPFIADVLEDVIVMFSRIDAKGKYNVGGLTDAIQSVIEEEHIDEVYFVDGGGDSMTLKPTDIIGESQSKDVFKGGDAFALEAIQDIPSTLCVTAVGLDVDREGFLHRLTELTEYDIYLGSQNLRELPEIYMYIDAANKILYRNPGDDKLGKYKSHTGSVLYCSIRKDWGVKRTYVQWEGEVDGEKGVLVRPDHAMMYMFKANKIHQLKINYRDNWK